MSLGCQQDGERVGIPFAAGADGLAGEATAP